MRKRVIWTLIGAGVGAMITLPAFVVAVAVTYSQPEPTDHPVGYMIFPYVYFNVVPNWLIWLQLPVYGAAVGAAAWLPRRTSWFILAGLALSHLAAVVAIHFGFGE